MEDNKNIISALEKLADKLGTKAEHIFGYYLKQAKLFRFRFLISVLVSGLFLCITTGALYYFRHAYKGDEIHCAILIACAIASITSVVAFALVLSGIDDLFTSVTNPEYMATKEILNALKSSD